MKRLMVLLAIVLTVALAAGSALAVPFSFQDSGVGLQKVLDGITVADGQSTSRIGVNDINIPLGDSSVDVTTDSLSDSVDSHWALTATGGSVNTLIIELAGFAGENTFGVYDIMDPSKRVEIFNGAAGGGAQVTFSLEFDGSVFLSGTDTDIDFADNRFGYYLDSSANTGGGLFYSDTSLNVDSADHMVAYRGTGDVVQLPNKYSGVWTENEYILAFEDVFEGGYNGFDGDYEFTDFVVMVESVNPVVPEPGTLLLLGGGLVGLAYLRKRKKV